VIEAIAQLLGTQGDGMILPLGSHVLPAPNWPESTNHLALSGNHLVATQVNSGYAGVRNRLFVTSAGGLAPLNRNGLWNTLA